MKVTISSNAAELSRTLRVLFRDQVPFSAAKALNRIAVEAQEAQRDGLDERFTLRRKQWAHRSIKIGREDWANKRRLSAAVRVEAPGDSSQSEILAKFEKGGTKRPKKGERVAVPAAIRTNPKQVIPKGKRPRSFKFSPVGGPMHISRKDPRVFMVRHPGGRGGIYRRQGRKGGTLVTLYRFSPRVKLAPQLKFEDTISSTARARYVHVFQEEFMKAVRTAR